MSDTHICTRGKVWDLHIHSNQCYSTTDEELKKLSVNDYVVRLIKVLEEYEDLDMISWLFGGFCGRDSGIGPAQRAKTTIWN